MDTYSNGKQQISELVYRYEINLNFYLNNKYNETQLRVDFVNPFFEALGWDVTNKNNLPQKSRDVMHEDSVSVVEDGYYKTKKPDYGFKAGTEVIFYLETKKPSVDITKDYQSAFQLRRYGWSGNLAISILTNFNDILIYDCTIKPNNTDTNNIALIKHYNYKDFIEKYDEIYDFISKEAVLTGKFKQKTDNLKAILEKESFDNYFLLQIKNWRLLLGKNIYKNNCIVNDEVLNIFVQRILNRILFLRICEDRKLELYENLKQVKSYKELKQLFENADKKYNSGLFSIIDKENLIIDDDVLINIFQELYYPKSPYEFSVVDSFIMGQIYELFLDEVLTIKNENVFIIKKDDIVDIHGTVNTPKNITDIIVEKSLGTWINNHTHNEIKEIKVADICCGSGNFLISSFEYLINYYTKYFVETNLNENMQNGNLFYSNSKQEYILSLKVRKEILKNNIFGCDIDPLACEITKFNLLLRTIEDIPEIEIQQLYTINKEKALPTLESNIKNGNSLIDSKYISYNKKILEDLNLAKRINFFDWETEYPFGKFDVIVGNPPYIRVQKIVKYVEDEYGYYKSSFSDYTTAKTELTDKYYLFVERMKQLLKKDGITGVIIPHKFMLIKSGECLRQLLSKGQSIIEIINFGTNQIFKGRDTYTCLLIFSNKPQKQFNISFISDLPNFIYTHQYEKKQFPIDYLSAAPWVFLPTEVENKINELKNQTIPLNSIADIFVGLQTSNDSIYILSPYDEDENYIYCQEKDNTKFKIEKGILRKCIYDIQLHSYEPIKYNSYLIYPYIEINEKPVLIPIEELKNKFPQTYSYLLKNKKKLEERNLQKRSEFNWYQFGRSQSLKRFFNGEHLIWSVLSLSGNYVYDDSLVTFTGGGNGPFYGLEVKKDSSYSIFYIQALLNHWLLELIVRNQASTFRGDYYSHGKQFIAKLPIRKIDFNNSLEKEKHDAIVFKVKNIMKLSKNLLKCQVETEANSIIRLIQCEKKELENLINDLYDVKDIQLKDEQ